MIALQTIMGGGVCEFGCKYDHRCTIISLVTFSFTGPMLDAHFHMLSNYITYKDFATIFIET